ncbi:hypothetical protein [Rhodopila sp.]|uniref:hypothetical protein n=1 Tax=Rhodopila sp. TaxID=2480087 RepID=UPI003D141680
MRDFLKALPIGVGLPLMFWTTSVGPEDVHSNVSKWLHWAGAENLPSWIIEKTTDRYTIAISLFLAIIYGLTVWVFIPRVRNYLEKRRHRIDPDALQQDETDRLMAAWSITHQYDIPIKLELIDRLVNLMLSEVLFFVSDADEVSRMWTSYIKHNDIDLLKAHLNNLSEELVRVWRRIETIRIDNLRYDDIRDILQQDYENEFRSALETFQKEVSDNVGDLDGEILEEKLAPSADAFRNAWRGLASWHGAVKKTLLIRRNWLVQQSAQARL